MRPSSETLALVCVFSRCVQAACRDDDDDEHVWRQRAGPHCRQLAAVMLCVECCCCCRLLCGVNRSNCRGPITVAFARVHRVCVLSIPLVSSSLQCSSKPDACCLLCSRCLFCWQTVRARAGAADARGLARRRSSGAVFGRALFVSRERASLVVVSFAMICEILRLCDPPIQLPRVSANQRLWQFVVDFAPPPCRSVGRLGLRCLLSLLAVASLLVRVAAAFRVFSRPPCSP